MSDIKRILGLGLALVLVACLAGCKPPVDTPPPKDPDPGWSTPPGPIITINPTANSNGNHWTIGNADAESLEETDERALNRGFFYLVKTFTVTTGTGEWDADEVTAKFKVGPTVYTLHVVRSPSDSFHLELDGQGMYAKLREPSRLLRSELCGDLESLEATYDEGGTTKTTAVDSVKLRAVWPQLSGS